MQKKTSPKNRICKYPSCNNRISIYNHELYCNVHLKAHCWEDRVDGIPVNKIKHDITDSY
jgi:hypothetical protein